MTMFIQHHPLISYVLYGDFGLFTIVPTFLFKILFPIITSFYLLQLFLIKSNLLQIISRKTDRFLHNIGLSANTLVPLVLGLGCVTVALGNLRLISEGRERRIAQILLCAVVPCSAQLVINTALVFQTGRQWIVLYIFLIFLIFLGLGLLLNLLFPDTEGKVTASYRCGKKVFFRMPEILPLLWEALKQGCVFLKETALPFALGNVIVSVLYYLGYVDMLCALAAPVVCGFLHLPAEAAAIFVLSIIKKDLGAASLLALFQGGAFSPEQSFVCIVMLTLFVPCFASVIILFKNEKIQISVGIWLFCLLLSMTVGKILSCLLIVQG